MTLLLHQDLSYIIRGCAIDIRKQYGPGQKEIIYQRLFAEKLYIRKLKFIREEKINILSQDTGKVIGIYQPDFVVEDKIIVELKAHDYSTKKGEEQLLYYLKNSKYELGFLINFSTEILHIKRIIYTNDRKPKFSVIQ